MTRIKCSKCGVETCNHLDGLCGKCLAKDAYDGTYYERTKQRRKKIFVYLEEQIRNGKHLFFSKQMGEVLEMTTKQVGANLKILRDEKNNLYLKRESKNCGRYSTGSKWWAEFVE